MTGTHSATIDSLQAVPAGQGDHHFFLNHLATVKVAAGESESGLALVEFLAPRGFGPPLHAHSEEDELMFVLREVFAFGHDEIAEAIGKSSGAVRQIAHRARSGVQARRPDLDAPVPQTPLAQQVAERFLRAAATGDLQDLLDVLAPDVVLTGDGGGKVTVNRRPVESADKVGRFLLGIRAKGFVGDVRLDPVLVNGRPGVLGYLDGVLDTVMTWDAVGDRVTAIYLVRNPDKLGAASRTRSVTR